MATTGRSAIIVGAGIGGLATALALQNTGWNVHVIERTGSTAVPGTGLSVWPNGTAALERLGLGERFERISVPVRGGALDLDGRPIMELDPADLRDRYGHGVRMVRREDLTALLAGALAVNTVHRGLPVVHFEPGTPSSTLVLENGGRQHAELVVGADGLNSLVRRALIGDGAPRRSGLTAFRAVCAAGSPDLASVPWGETWGPGAVFGMAPLPGGQTYWYGTISSDEFRSSPLTTLKAMALDRFGHWNSGIAQVIGRTAEEAVMAHELFDRKPEPVWSGRSATLVGDAAHPMLPFLGQGACQALEDAVVLADSLAAAGNVQDGLLAYDAERVPRTSRIVKRSRSMGRLAQLQRPRLRTARNSVLRILPRGLRLKQLDGVLGPAARPE
ncbi:FAD-dependent monooxygenase [Arthrobacter sp. I2-34]|uniref:FAD-dependent monooxygenase n=1 Tax=Arthrobacter hankyongi TaxID=2904801 RepID=A0ABS9LA38_9MICC|nr:FAD-dependent monooxygenase [Arthrobacter hankyongi]MCG2623547.1 FAD-dependent monooxygenase [Arthrobacter hankyongi]